MSKKNKQIKTVITVIVFVIAIFAITTSCGRNNDASTMTGDSGLEEVLVEVPDLVGYSLEALTHEFEDLDLVPSLFILTSDEPEDTVLFIDGMGQHVSASATIRVLISGGESVWDLDDPNEQDPTVEQPDLEPATPTAPEPPSDQYVRWRMRFGGIDWLVLDEDEENSKILLLSEFALFDMVYNDTFIPVTWETSTIRSYLNNEFFNSFSPRERERIAETRIINTGHLATFEFTHFTWYVPGGNDTDDRIFLLSFDEVKRYFPIEADRAVLKPKDDEHYPGERWAWWLRSPGLDNFNGIMIKLGGVDSDINQVTGFGPANGIRPAMWVYVI